jgi:4a-hydroxytetrahydrobiopterin dehydratase
MTTTHSDLTSKKCQACEGAAGKLSPDAITDLLKQTPGWNLINGELRRTFKFKNYYESTAFVNATAWISHRENHHPDIELGYNQVTMRYSTHSAGGLTENDFICAAKANALMNV